MDTRVAAWVLLLLLSALVMEVREVRALEQKRKLCGRHLLRAVLDACGRSHWLLELERAKAGRHRREVPQQEPLALDPELPKDEDPALLTEEKPGAPIPPRRHKRDHHTVSEFLDCCSKGCNLRDLQEFC